MSDSRTIVMNKPSLSAKPLAYPSPVSFTNGLEFKDSAIKNFADYLDNKLMLGPNSIDYLSPQTSILENQVRKLINPAPPSLLSSSRQKTSIEHIFNATAEIKILTSQVAMHLDASTKSKLFAQIDSLHDYDDWDPDDKPIQKDSFRSLLRTMLFIKPQRHPGIGLSHNGNVVAVWLYGDSKLSAEFLGNDQIKWIVKLVTEDNEIERVAGTTKIARFIECLKPYNPDIFFKK